MNSIVVLCIDNRPHVLEVRKHRSKEVASVNVPGCFPGLVSRMFYLRRPCTHGPRDAVPLLCRFLLLFRADFFSVPLFALCAFPATSPAARRRGMVSVSCRRTVRSFPTGTACPCER